MTYLMIDPASLDGTAAVFRTATEILNELGPQVARACDAVLAPPGVAANVGLELSTAALALQTVALELLQEAGDLTRRASCCYQDDAASLPVPALVGLAFGSGASLGGQPIQFGSAVSAEAASGPGVFAPAASMGAAPVAAPPMSLHAALAGGATLGGNAPLGGPSLHQVFAGGATLGGNAPVGAPSLHQVLGGGANLGGDAPVPGGITLVPNPWHNQRLPGLDGAMVYNPSYNASPPGLGVYTVPNPNPPPFGYQSPMVASPASVMNNRLAEGIGISMHNDFVRSQIGASQRLTALYQPMGPLP